MARSVQVTLSGPLFDGSARGIVDDMLTDARRAVAERVVTEIRQELRRVLKNPTGYYERQVTYDVAGRDPRVTDGGVVYGPWLEGVSRRNAASRFKGYATFRRVSQRLADQAAELAEPAVGPHLDRLGRR